ncbi:MAG: class I SAM-dependent methyltransferase [Pseudomonadota bacterium]
MNDQKGENQGHFSKAYSLKSAEETKAHYKEWAQSYDQEVGEQNGYAQPARTAEMLARHCDLKEITVLDAGCGSGLSGLALSQAGVETIDGCDFSPEMLEQARAKNVYRNLLQADLNAPLTQIPDEVYDAVVAVGVFSFGHVSPDACDELIRIIRPQGHLIIALNEQYWEKGDLARKLDQLTNVGRLQLLAKEYGDHLPGHDVNGWVIAARKAQ